MNLNHVTMSRDLVNSKVFYGSAFNSTPLNWPSCLQNKWLIGCVESHHKEIYILGVTTVPKPTSGLEVLGRIFFNQPHVEENEALTCVIIDQDPKKGGLWQSADLNVRFYHFGKELEARKLSSVQFLSLFFSHYTVFRLEDNVGLFVNQLDLDSPKKLVDSFAARMIDNREVYFILEGENPVSLYSFSGSKAKPISSLKNTSAEKVLNSRVVPSYFSFKILRNKSSLISTATIATDTGATTFTISSPNVTCMVNNSSKTTPLTSEQKDFFHITVGVDVLVYVPLSQNISFGLKLMRDEISSRMVDSIDTLARFRNSDDRWKCLNLVKTHHFVIPWFNRILSLPYPIDPNQKGEAYL
eukprot:TRINITY_DN865_c1_g1_i1.p1 TRINITY_DN865_c1_g1~~TRINITY_DN865_c1_g1_i1.p1  ORF type:complete len:356 (+),score=67.76 TRINITY_DN865_c1_g1_i1:195-1262(+)